MSFKFKGTAKKEVWSCTNCIYVSTKKHFRETDSDVRCTLCNAPARNAKTIEQEMGMSSFEYQTLLEQVGETKGVGSATIDRIEDAYDEGDDFVSVCKLAYEKGNYDKLSELKGVGESTARDICLRVADERGWENGAAESGFSFT
jgi:hypothetical protein